MAVFNKIKILFIFCFVFFFGMPHANAQEKNSYWQVDYARGSIYKHKKIISRLYTERPDLISIGWHKTADKNSSWKERYNFPDWGLVLMNQQFHTEHLGNTTALNYTTTYYLRDRNAKNQFNIQLGFGGGYNTKPLDFDTNLLNVAMTSHMLFTQHLKINYLRPELFDKLGLHAGIYFTHFSNGSFKKPNLGINSIFLNLGLSYLDKKKDVIYERLEEKEKFEKQPIHFNISLHGGFHESKPGIGIKPVYYISGYTHKKIGYKSKLQFGFDFINSQSVKDFAEFWYLGNQNETENNQRPDHKELAIFGGHELIFNKLSLETQVGYYLYRPFNESAPIYQKVAFKHYLNSEKSAVSISMIIHYFEAEFICLGYHHQIF